MRVPRSRLEKWLKALEEAERLAHKVRAELGPATVILHGSYARGDFNLWSDVDIIIVSPRFRGVRILDRYSLVEKIIPPGFEPVLMTPEEFRAALEKPAWRQALARGHVILADDLNLRHTVVKCGALYRRLDDIKKELEKLLAQH